MNTEQVSNGFFSTRTFFNWDMSIATNNVVNLTGGVTTDDGRVLYGLDAETYLRVCPCFDFHHVIRQVKAKEDPEVERKTGEWIEDVLGRSLEDTSDLYKSLKNGVALCE